MIKWLRKKSFLGLLVYFLARALLFTTRLTMVFHRNYNPNLQALFAFWHGNQFYATMLLNSHHCIKGGALVSASHDGDILSNWLQRAGYEVIRGSSRNDNVKSLKAIMRYLAQGKSFGIALDGPKGPRYKIKPGIVHLAKKFHLPIIPIYCSASSCWNFNKAWDQFEIPKPFSKLIYHVGQPLFVKPQDNIEEAIQLLEKKMESLKNNK